MQLQSLTSISESSPPAYRPAPDYETALGRPSLDQYRMVLVGETDGRETATEDPLGNRWSTELDGQDSGQPQWWMAEELRAEQNDATKVCTNGCSCSS